MRESHHALVEASEREQADRILAQADSLLAQAQSLDPVWAEPVVLRGWVAVERALVFAEEAGEYDAEDRPLLDAALAGADQALSLDPENADALALRGTVTFGLARAESSETSISTLLDNAERDLRAAGETSPMQAKAWAELGELLQVYRADFAAAKQAYEEALISDPFLLDAKGIALKIGILSTDLEEYDDAWSWYQEGRRRWPESVNFPALGLTILASTSGLGGAEAARALADTIVQTMSLDRYPEFEPIWEAQVSTVLWRDGFEDSARAVLLRAETITPDSGFAAYDLAHAWLVQGEIERCFEWLEIDLEENPSEKAYRATEPWFRPLHDDPRFQELVRIEGAESG
jgi:tetratricopeptide (TPR) repeat protein